MYVIGFSATASTQIVGPILAIYLKDFLLASIPEVGLAVSVFFLTSALSKLPVGFSARGTRTTLGLILSLLICSICPSAYVLAKDLAVFNTIRAIHGFGAALFGVTGLTLISSMALSGKRVEAISSFIASLAVGLMAGPAIGTLSVALLGIKNTFFIASLPSLIGLAMAYSLARNTSLRVDYGSGRNLALSDLSMVLSNRLFKGSFLAYMSFSFVFGVLLAYAPIHARENLGFSIGHITSLFFGYFLVITGVRFMLGRLIEKLGEERMLSLGLLNTTLMGALMYFVNAPAVFTAAFVCLGLSHGVVYPTAAIVVARTVKPAELALANSIYLVAFDLGTFFGPTLTSVVATSYGIPSALALSGIFPGLVAMIIRKTRLTRSSSSRSQENST